MTRIRLRLLSCLVWLAFGHVPLCGQIFLVNTTNAAGCSNVVALCWNPSPDSDTAGYLLCWGFASGEHTNQLDVGNATGATVGGLGPGVVYYFSAAAYGVTGSRSPPSNEIEYSIDGAASGDGVSDAPPVVAFITPPTIEMAAQTGSIVTLTWGATAGQSYQVQYCTDLTLTNWMNLGTPIIATEARATASDVVGPDPQRFYRVVLVP